MVDKVLKKDQDYAIENWAKRADTFISTCFKASK